MDDPTRHRPAADDDTPRGVGTRDGAVPEPSGSPVPDGGHVEVALSDWEAVVEHLRRFGGPGDVEVREDRVTVTVGSAHLTVTRDGRVETGMPLHEFSKSGVEVLSIDHDAGYLRVRGGDGLAYEFRRPGG